MTRAMKALVTIMSLILVARGIDWLTGDSYYMGKVWGGGLDTPELWGAACLIVAGLAFLGLLLNRQKIVVNAGIAGAAVCTMFAVQIADQRMFAWPPEDIRLIADHLGHAATWALATVTILHRSAVEGRKTEILEEADG